MSSYNAQTSDCGLLRADGTTTCGLTLVRDKNGYFLTNPPSWQEYDDEILARQSFEGAPDYSYMPPEKEIVFLMDDWRGGMGQKYFDLSEPKRYYSSTNVDARFKGKIIAGPLAATVTLPSLPTAVSVTNGNMELNSGWTGGTQSATQKHGGSYSWRLTATPEQAHQHPTWDNGMRGFVYSLAGYLWAANASTVRLFIYDGKTYTYSGYHTGASAWERFTVTKKLALDATELTIGFINAQAFTTYADDLVLAPPAAGNPTVFCDFNSELYMGEGNVLSKLNAAGTAFTYVHSFNATIRDLCPYSISGTDYLFIAIGDNDYLWYETIQIIDTCEVVWSELIDTDVTIALDPTVKTVGDNSLKFTVADPCAAGDILGTQVVSFAITIATSVAFTMDILSSVALTAGDLQFLVDDTAKCASPTLSLDIPAISANTMTRVTLFFTPQSLTAASIGFKMIVDKGAFTLNIDNIQMLSMTQHTSEAAYFLGATSSTMYAVKQTGNAYLRSAATPTGAFSNVCYVGFGGDPHTDLLVDESNNVLVGKTDCPYYITSTPTALSLMPEFRVLKSSTSCKNMIAAFGNIYVQGGDQTLMEFDGTPGSSTAVKTNISPAMYISDASSYSGKIQALAKDDNYLYAILDNSTYAEVLAGRWETIDGTTSWVWHPIAELTLTGCETAHVSNVYKKRLWIASTSSSDSLYYLPLTTKYGDIPNDTNYLYQTGGNIVTPWLHGQLKSDNKAYYKLTCTLGHAYDAGIYFTAHYEKWGDDLSGGVGWTSIGNFDGTLVNRVETIYIPADSSSVKPVSPYIRFKLVPVTNDTSKTPILEAFDCRGAWRPAKRWLIVCTIQGDEEMVTQSGQIEKGSMANTKTVLEEAVAATWPVTFYDLDGSTIYVNFLDMREIPNTIEPTGSGKRIKRNYACLLQKVTLS